MALSALKAANSFRAWQPSSCGHQTEVLASYRLGVASYRFGVASYRLGGGILQVGVGILQGWGWHLTGLGVASSYRLGVASYRFGGGRCLQVWGGRCCVTTTWLVRLYGTDILCPNLCSMLLINWLIFACIISVCSNECESWLVPRSH